MPPKRHKIINKSRGLNANLVKRQDEFEKEIELAERELSELKETDEGCEEIRMRLIALLSEKKRQIETIQDLRTVFVSIIEDHHYLTDDNLDAMDQSATRRMSEFMQETDEPEKTHDSEADGENKATVKVAKKGQKNKNPNRRKREEGRRRRGQKRKRKRTKK